MIWRCMLKNKINYVIFDLDDTLYNEREYVLQAMREVARYIHVKKNNLGEEYVYNRLLAILEEDGRGKIFNRICLEEKLELDFMELVRVYRNTKPKLRIYEDAEYLISELKKRNIKIGMITDGLHFVQRNKIDGLDIVQLFDSIVVSDEHGLSKPDERVYQISLGEARVENPSEAVYIGDNPTKDFLGAKKIGMNKIRSVRACGDHMQTKVDDTLEANYTITNMKEVLEVCQI